MSKAVLGKSPTGGPQGSGRDGAPARGQEMLGRDAVTGQFQNRVQIKNPLTGHYLKIDTTTGRVLAQKKTPGKYSGIREISKEK